MQRFFLIQWFIIWDFKRRLSTQNLSANVTFTQVHLKVSRGVLFLSQNKSFAIFARVFSEQVFVFSRYGLLVKYTNIFSVIGYLWLGMAISEYLGILE